MEVEGCELRRGGWMGVAGGGGAVNQAVVRPTSAKNVGLRPGLIAAVETPKSRPRRKSCDQVQTTTNPPAMVKSYV